MAFEQIKTILRRRKYFKNLEAERRLEEEEAHKAGEEQSLEMDSRLIAGTEECVRDQQDPGL